MTVESKIRIYYINGVDTKIDGLVIDVGNVETKVDTLSTDVAAVDTTVSLLQKYEEGRWKIHVTGGDANRLVLYDTDDVTPILKFDLKDSGGSATFVNPFERVPV